jgi:hypothetical protein
MPSINPGQLLADIQTAATGAAGQDIASIQGFARDQLLRIEKLSIQLAEMIAQGEFKDDPDGQREFLGILQDLITNFTKTLRGLAVITVEKVWNAIVGVVWNALDAATGLALPRPIP